VFCFFLHVSLFVFFRFFSFFFFFFFFVRNLQQIDPDNGPNDRFEEVDLRVDDANFEGNSDEIEIGNFVSFRYILQNRKLINPKVSNKKQKKKWLQNKKTERKKKEKLTPQVDDVNFREFRNQISFRFGLYTKV
jgi:hypothetical protein